MCGEAGKKNGNVKTAAQTEQKYSTNNYEITFENLEVSDDIENILAHRVLIDMIGIEMDGFRRKLQAWEKELTF